MKTDPVNEECVSIPQRSCPMTAHGIRELRDLIVDPVVERIGEMERKIDRRNDAQDRRLAQIEKRVLVVEEDQREIRGGWKRMWAAIAVGVAALQVVLNVGWGWVQKKMGW